MISTKKTLIALGVAASFAMSGAANAGALASSTFSITNFLLSNAATGVTLNVSDFTGLVANNNANTSANLVGSPIAGSTFNLPITSATPTDLLRATSGNAAGAPVENNFMVLTPPPVAGNFANADQLLTGSAIQVGPPTTGANARVRSDVVLTGTGEGAAASNVGVNATFIFSLTQAINIGVNFNGAVDLIAFTDAGSNAPSNAQASSGLVITLRILNGADVFAFNNAPGATGCRLGSSRTVNAPVNGTASFQCIDSFSASTGLLLANTAYELSIRQETAANARLVSEPGVLSLMGLGLLGIGAALRKRKAV